MGPAMLGYGITTFQDCKFLVGLSSNYDLQYVTKLYIRIDGGLSMLKMFSSMIATCIPRHWRPLRELGRFGVCMITDFRYIHHSNLGISVFTI